MTKLSICIYFWEESATKVNLLLLQLFSTLFYCVEESDMLIIYNILIMLNIQLCMVITSSLNKLKDQGKSKMATLRSTGSNWTLLGWIMIYAFIFSHFFGSDCVVTRAYYGFEVL